MKTILLVEDSRFMRLVNERNLAKAGYSVATAGDGEEALRLAFERPPDLIVLDMLLPKLDGLQVIRTLKKNGATLAIPIVVLSSLPQTNEARLKKEGVSAYCDKSALGIQSSDSLVQLVRTLLGDVAPDRPDAAIPMKDYFVSTSKGEA